MTRSVIGSGVALDHPGKYETLIDVHRVVNPTTMLGMVDAVKDADKIRQLQRDLPNAQVVARVWHPEEGGYAQPPKAPGDNRPMIATPEAVLGDQVELGHNGLWLHVMNEPSAFMEPWQIQLTVDWLVKFIRLAAPENCACVLGNLADQHPKLINGWWDPLWWPFLRVLAEHPHLMKLGLHFYGPDKLTDVLVALNETCKELRIVPPQVVGTEFGLDSTGQGDKANGYHNRGWSGAQFLQWKRAQVQGPLKPFIASGQLIGLDTFQWNVLWGPFSTAQDEGYQREYKESAQRGELDVEIVTISTKPVYTPGEQPENATGGYYYSVKFPSVNTIRNLRGLPSADSDDLGDVTSGDLIQLFDLPLAYDSINRKFQFCVLVDKVTGEIKGKGWLWTDGIQLSPTTKPEAPVVVTPEPPPQETAPPPAIPVPEVLKRWSFGLEVLCTDFQSQMLQQGLEKLFEAAGFIGLAAGAQVSVQRQEMPMEVS